jgi:hypothetical protein
MRQVGPPKQEPRNEGAAFWHASVDSSLTTVAPYNEARKSLDTVGDEVPWFIRPDVP